MLAIPAFLPVSVCTGYLVAWFADLFDFRRRTFIERLFWSIPLSIGISTISAVLIGKAFSLFAVSAFFILSAFVFTGVVGWELFQSSRFGAEHRFSAGLLDRRAAILAFLWAAFTVVSLVDFQKDQRLIMNGVFLDHGARVNWAESIERTGIPPANPMYFFQHAAGLRYYYFWLVDCAAVATFSHLQMREVAVAGCVWAGFCLASLLGLYLKYFLTEGTRLRRQFLLSIGLLTVTGPYVVIDAWDIFVTHSPLPGIEVWREGQITSWIDNCFYYPHHVLSMACCMFAFLLAWIASERSKRFSIPSIVMIGFLFASAFGLSVYVAFAFFLIMLAWGVWQLGVERRSKPVWHLVAGGVVAAALLVPYLLELKQGASRIHGGSVFRFSVRETIPPSGLLASPLLRHLALIHETAARNLAKLILMAPGYAVELGFYFLVLVAYLVPAWRGRKSLNSAQRALLFIVFVTFPIISFIRSDVLAINDYGIHGGMFVLFPLSLLASDFVVGHDIRELRTAPSTADTVVPKPPVWLWSGAKVCLSLGILSTIYIAAVLRFGILGRPDVRALTHKAYISAVGYGQLGAVISSSAVVQFDPVAPDSFWQNTDLANINRQTAIASDQLWCGSELGGDPTGCPAMASAIDDLYRDAGAGQAKSTCHQFGIQFLVATTYDPVWNDKRSWVWTLRPVVQDSEFRALDCRF